ncbi:MAG: O-antigen/teichoic acid export membrane protein [Planctomycetota bacterium]
MLKGLFANRFVRNAAALQVGAAFNSFGGFVSLLVLAYLLGAKLQGEYYTAVAMYAGLGLLVNIGVLQGTVNQLAGAVARGLDQKVTEWLAFLVKSYLLLGLLLPVIGWFALGPIGEFMVYLSGEEFAVGSDGYSPEQLAWFLTFTPLLEIPRQMVAAALQGTRRMVDLAQMENGQEFVRVFCVCAGALITFSPLGPVIGLMAGSAIGSVIALSIYSRARTDGGYNLPIFREVFAQFGRVKLAHGLPLCIRIGILRNIDSLAFNVFPQLVVRTFASSEWVTYFWASHRIMNVPLMLMQGISRTALPAMSELRGMKDMEMFRKQWLRVTIYGGGLISAGILIGLPLIPYVADRIFPPDYHEPISLLTKILAVGFVPSAFCIAIDTFFIVTGRIKVLMLVGVLGTPIYIVLTIVLCQFDPTTGAAWGYAFARLIPVVCFFYIARFFRQERLEAKKLSETVEAKSGTSN